VRSQALSINHSIGFTLKPNMLPRLGRWQGQAWRVTVAFLNGVLLGVTWECASMLVLLAATVLEHLAGTICMIVCFTGLAAAAYSVAARADLGKPLLGILAFRLSAQLAMTLGTGSVCSHALICILTALAQMCILPLRRRRTSLPALLPRACARAFGRQTPDRYTPRRPASVDPGTSLFHPLAMTLASPVPGHSCCSQPW
jgi:hypothetical protein